MSKNLGGTKKPTKERNPVVLYFISATIWCRINFYCLLQFVWSLYNWIKKYYHYYFGWPNWANLSLQNVDLNGVNYKFEQEKDKQCSYNQQTEQQKDKIEFEECRSEKGSKRSWWLMRLTGWEPCGICLHRCRRRGRAEGMSTVRSPPEAASRSPEAVKSRVDVQLLNSSVVCRKRRKKREDWRGTGEERVEMHFIIYVVT